MTEAEREFLLKRIKYNSTDMGELGNYVKIEYVVNEIEAMRQKASAEEEPITPGPWSYTWSFMQDAEERGLDIYAMRSPHGSNILIGRAENEADAKAIAALPELLVAAKELCEALETRGDPPFGESSSLTYHVQEEWEAVQAALNKAGVEG